MSIREITLRNLLSFGHDTEPLALGPLNVIIGPNGSGKSNLLDAIDLLRNAPEQLFKPIREGGGINEWLWKGGKILPYARIDTVIGKPMGQEIRHILSFVELGQRSQLMFESIENAGLKDGEIDVYFYYRYLNGHRVLNDRGEIRKLAPERVDSDRSILAQLRDPDHYPEVTDLSDFFAAIRLYRDWTFGRSQRLRRPEPADGLNGFLEPDAGNLGLVLNRLRQQPIVKKRILQALQELYAGIDDFDIRIDSGTVQVVLQEGAFTIPATRLSDGTLRYLYLLAILCHPNPPPLVCIEEPELGLHPDILPSLARLLREASERCQLIVTTHSEILVDCMTDTPEAVIVCEKHDGATTLTRLSAGKLKPWLEKYRLGDLWTRGDIGGNRW